MNNPNNIPADRVRELTQQPKPPKYVPSSRGGPRRDGLFTARIPEETVRKIRLARAQGHTVMQIATTYNVSGAYVSMVCSGKRRRIGRK